MVSLKNNRPGKSPKMPKEHFGYFAGAVRVKAFSRKRPPTCSNLVYPNCGRWAGFTELAWLSVIALLVGGRKDVILFYCRLSVMAVYEVHGQRGRAVFAGKLFITEL